jgi:protein gp37/ParB-like chromosome segregation protein Spo0J
MSKELTIPPCTLEECVKAFNLTGVHPAANIFPMMSEDEYLALARSVAIQGLEHDIILTHDGRLLDGRNRLMAVYATGQNERFRWLGERTDEQYLQYSLDANLHRRQLTPSQKAVAALEVEKVKAGFAKERQVEAIVRGNKSRHEEKEESPVPQIIGELGAGKTASQKAVAALEVEKKMRENESAKQAAKATGANHAYVSDAKKIEKEAPEMIPEIASGKKTIPQAKRELKEREATVAKKTMNKVNENIGWAQFSWNPITGCKHGCEYCYAKDLHERLFHGPFETYHFKEDRLAMPANTPNTGANNRVFVGSMADVFGDWVPAEDIERVIDVMAKNDQFTFLLLTKNPKRYSEFTFPKNCWKGTTIDTQARADAAAEYAGSFDFVSMEPLLEEVALDGKIWDSIRWLIIGAKSEGQKKIQPDSSWIDPLIVEAMAGDIALWLKDNLIYRPQEVPQ